MMKNQRFLEQHTAAAGETAQQLRSFCELFGVLECPAVVKCKPRGKGCSSLVSEIFTSQVICAPFAVLQTGNASNPSCSTAREFKLSLQRWTWHTWTLGRSGTVAASALCFSGSSSPSRGICISTRLLQSQVPSPALYLFSMLTTRGY